MAVSKDLTIQQGKTFTLALRWETEPVVRKAISGISFDGGAVETVGVCLGVGLVAHPQSEVENVLLADLGEIKLRVDIGCDPVFR